MSNVTIYNDGCRDIQVTTVNLVTRKDGTHKILPAAQREGEGESIQIDLGFGDAIFISMCDGVDTKLSPPGGAS